jgi:hypothetical protein
MLSLFTCFEDLDKISLMCLCRDQSIKRVLCSSCWQVKYYEINYRCYLHKHSGAQKDVVINQSINQSREFFASLVVGN